MGAGEGSGDGSGGGRYSGKKCRLVSMFSLTVVFFLVEIIVGKKFCKHYPTESLCCSPIINAHFKLFC